MRSLAVLLLTVFAFAASAADISGTWKGTAETPNGAIERTFLFKCDGVKLTGESTSEIFGKSTISDGKIEGDAVSFILTVKFQDNEMKLNYKGKIKGEELVVTVELPDGNSLDYKAKKVS